MPDLLALLVLVGGIVFWIWRIHSAVQTAGRVGGDSEGLPRHARKTAVGVVGSKLRRVQDTRLAATILMQQLVRTGAPVTVAEKTQIKELMENPLGISDIDQIFLRAWGYTEQGRAFAAVADELTPLLRAKLTRKECFELVDMLKQVANAYVEASELQTEAISRLRRQLTAPDPEGSTRIERGVG